MPNEKTPSWPNDNERYHLGSLEKKLKAGERLPSDQVAYLRYMYSVIGGVPDNWRKTQSNYLLRTQYYDS